VLNDQKRGGLKTMAVITKYFIVRKGVELDKVFEDKKEADAYDKMLDAAEKLADFIRQGDLELDDVIVDEISVYLAKNGPEVTKILKGVKPLKKTPPPSAKPKKQAETEPVGDKKSSNKKSGPKSKDK
jgi:dsDNA-binding SOS-regulon protein